MVSSDQKPPTVAVSGIQLEHFPETFGIGSDHPHISWTVETEQTGWAQTAYEIEYLDVEGNIQGQTGRIESDQSVSVAWPFKPLSSRERLALRVRVWGTDGQPSDWSNPCPVEVGLLHPEDWAACFITPAWQEDVTKAQPAPHFRREFSVRFPVKYARLYITALGVYEAQINGWIIDDHVMDPGWTSYPHRLRYQTFDVTQLIHEGRNALGVIVGDGWFRGRLGFDGGRRNVYGDHLALLGQLEITYLNGSIELILTNESWRATTGPILSSDIYDGEKYDARLELTGWSQPGFPDDGWFAVRRTEWNLSTLEAPLGPPVRRIEFIKPVAMLYSPCGKLILDFGQNLVGRLRLRVQGPQGQVITLRHAEVLENGELCTRPLRTAKATDQYILRGEGEVEDWEPRFTFHGFRYAEVDNWPGKLSLDDIQAVVCHSDLKRTGWFECSDPFINRLHENVVWSMRGNFLDLPTDCPQRDERLGWTGDLQIFAATATFLYDVSGFLSSWLKDLAAEQQDAGGVVPPVIPNVIGEPVNGVAAWGDAAVVVPWVLYQACGDPTILMDQFQSMRAWVDWIADFAGENYLWDHGIQYGDWLDPAAPPDRPEEALTDPYLIATAYFAHSADLLGRVANILGFGEENEYYQSLAREIRKAFSSKYLNPSGRLRSDTQTAYALALEFALLPDPAQRQHMAERLVELVRENGYQIGTGFVGTPLICDALCNIGEAQEAYQLLRQQKCPSWLYPVTMGATTIWERWDCILPDGSINPSEMTSFNHYALGSVADWLHRFVGGIAPLEPGYRMIEVHPHPGGGISRASTRYLTPYGMTECKWEIQEGHLAIEVIVPPNTIAIVHLPGNGGDPIKVGSGTYKWLVAHVGLE